MNTNTSGMSETRQLTDDELNTVNGGIIVVCGQSAVALAQNIGSAGGGGGAGKVTFDKASPEWF
jgi:bacteriocin-like protein